MEMITVTAKTVEDAITQASVQLGVSSDRLQYEVVEKGSAGVLGGLFGSRPAIIRAKKIETVDDKAVEFLNSVFDAMGISVDVETKLDEEEKELEVNLTGGEMGILIGKRGQTLDSLQYLVSLVVNKKTDEYLRVKLDTENYRARRKETLETLFGAGYRLNRTKDLSQPGQFACAERVTLEGPRGSLKNVVILGPERPESQVEISLTDAVALGLTPPVRLSGDTEGTPGLTLRHGDRVLRLSRGLIVAKRHIHMTPEDAARFGVADRQRVRLQCFTSRPLVFQDVEVRVSPQFSTVVHIDYDEANACGFQKGDRGVILK